MADNIHDELKWRGLIYDATDGIRELVTGPEPLTLYNGFDPTGDSLHVGHLVPLINLARFQRFGHSTIAVAGGGTGMVGDPSGKSEERILMSREQVEANVAKIKEQLSHFLDFDTRRNPARLVDNYDWLQHVGMMQFLRDVGKNFTVNYMLAKDSVQGRLDRETGISYTEFSYMLLQAYDYLTLFDRYGCRLQTGGSDQWGNIVAGVELIRRMRGEKVAGLVYPLITRPDGSKFGKTATGDSVWLDPQKTSPYRFYQFWLNTEDEKVVDYLKFFTFLDREEAEALAEKVATQPEARAAQRSLAEEMTRLVHGPTELARAETASAVLFGGDLEGLNARDIADIFADVPSSEVPGASLQNGGTLVVDLVAGSGLAGSRGQAKRDVQGGGIYVNNRRVDELGQTVTLADAIDGQFLVLRKGKKRYHLIRVVS
ncbi:MAG: tyrosine--tRNA ligase [Anaerolineae bacterium]|nr:tyrosine--tRNA ligase [Anaerolineae bacterium]